jgi:alanyl-tRNA synthetase
MSQEGKPIDIVTHVGAVLRGEIRTGQTCTLRVSSYRQLTMKNHTSTHMLNWALREVLGDHVQQKGSLVDPEKTRFDFSHNKPLTDEELARVETLVNEMIERDLPVFAQEAGLDKARKIKTLRAVFGEKYADPVRIISVGAPINEDDAKQRGEGDWLLNSPTDDKWMKYPVEFCGGTHLERSSQAKRFVLIAEEGVAKGVRRVVGITADAAGQAETTGRELLAEAQSLASGSKDDNPPHPPLIKGGSESAAPGGPPGTPPIPNRDREGAAPSRGLQPARTSESLSSAVTAFQQKVTDAVIPVLVRRELQRRITDLQKKAKAEEKQAASASSDAVQEAVAKLLASAETVTDVKIVVGQVPAADPNALRSAIDWVRNKTEASVVLLASVSDEKVTLIAGISKSVVKKGAKAGDLIKEVAPLVGGRGGGRPDMAQGGGTDPGGVPEALERANAWIHSKLSA